MKDNGKSNDSLNGKDNKRLDNFDATNKEGTAAWQDTRKQNEVDLVNDPAQDRVAEAKDWVDNGSKL